ncbi:MAG: glycosyltransferase family 9 protein [Pseudomonadota bacterium]
MSHAQWQQARRILCIRLDSLGDVLMCTPAMRAIKQSLPNCTLTLLTSASGAAAAPYIEDVDAVIEYAAPWMKAEVTPAGDADAFMIELLSERNFDAAIILTSFSQSALPAALLCYLAGIPLRLAHCRENPYHLLSDWIADPEPAALIRHEVRRQLDLVAQLGWSADHARLSFSVPPGDHADVRSRLLAHGISERQPFILMHTGASAPSRRYPPALWIEVIQGVRRQTGCPVVLTGDVHELGLIEQIKRACAVKVVSLAGELDLGQLGAAIELACVVVANNTGPAHMAAAIGTPLAELYALTNPQHTPWQVESRLLFHDVPCRFCYQSACPEGHHDCLGKVPPERVVEAVCSLLAARTLQQARS